VILDRYYSTEQNKKDEVGKARNMHGGEQRCIKRFYEKKQEET